MALTRRRAVGQPMAATLALLALPAMLTIASCTRPENVATDAPSDVDQSTETVLDTASETSVAVTTTTSDASAPTSTAAVTGSALTTATTTAPTTAEPEPAEPTTTPTPTSTAAPVEPIADLTLLFDGVAPFRFGDRDVDVVPALGEAFGQPILDEVVEYPTANAGVFVDAAEEQSYVAPFGRTVCFDNGLCLQFGAGAPETLIFTGWQVDAAAQGLTTENGIVVGATLADHADMISFDLTDACGPVVGGTADGLEVTLVSTDGGFAGPAAPDPGLITVQAISAGALPTPVSADC